MRKYNNRGSLALTLHDATLRLETDHALFLTYARRYLADLPSAADAAPNVVVNLHWDAVPARLGEGTEVFRWGRRVLQADRRILQTEIVHLPGLQLEAHWSDQKLVIDAYYRPTSRLERLAHWLGREIPPLFTILIYYLVYFPLIHYLEQTRGWHLLHAGAVTRPDGAWLLAGLPGSGKSTFTVGLLAHPQAKLLSENLLLFDAHQLYAFPEPIHLSQTSQLLLPADARQRVTNTGRDFSHGRQDFWLPPEARAWQTQPKALFFLALTSQTECRPIPTDVALNRLLAFDRLAKEIDAYAQFAASLELVAPQPGRIYHHHLALESLVSSLNCYELYLQQGADLTYAVQLAGQVLTTGIP
jgi:hypothetical protein